MLRSSTSSRRAYVPRRVIGATDERALLRQLQAPGFQPGRDALVEGARVSAGRGTVHVARDEPERVDLRVDLAKSGLVVLNDSLRDGWSVRVDGTRRAAPVRVNSVVRGVTVPAGRHTVTWVYRVPGLRLSLLVAALALLAAGAWLMVLRGYTRPVDLRRDQSRAGS